MYAVTLHGHVVQCSCVSMHVCSIAMYAYCNMRVRACACLHALQFRNHEHAHAECSTNGAAHPCLILSPVPALLQEIDEDELEALKADAGV